MEIAVNSHGSTKLVLVPSAVDGETVVQVEKVLRQLIDEEVRNIVCNFSRTETVSEAGLAMFIAVLKDFHTCRARWFFAC